MTAVADRVEAAPHLRPAHRSPWRSVAAIAAAFVLVGAGFLAAFGPETAITSDDGAYALAAQARAEGDWSVPYAFADADPDGVAYPNRNVGSSANGYIPVSGTPAWTVSLAAGDVVAGIWGMRLVVLAAGAAAIVGAAALAVAAGRRDAAVLAAGIVALSPVAFNSLQLWAHGPATAAFTLALVGALRLVRGHTWLGSTAMAMAGAGVAAALRADALVFCGAIAFGLGVMALTRRRPSLVVSAGAVSVAALSAELGSARIAARLRGGGGGGGLGIDSRAGSAPVTDRIEGWLSTLFSSQGASPLAFVLLVVAVVCVAAAIRAVRRDDTTTAVTLVVVASAAWVARAVIAPADMADGFLGAWPIALAVLLPRRSDPAGGDDGSHGAERFLVIVAVVGVVGVLATQYDIGGGFNWGGRYLSSLIPVVAVLVAIRVRDLHDRVGAPRPLRIAMISLAVVVAAGSLVTDADYRSRTDGLVDRVVAVAAASHPTDAIAPPVVVTGQLSLPLLAWRTAGDLDWLRIPRDERGGVDALVDVLDTAGIDRIVAVHLTDEQFAALTGRPEDENRPLEPFVTDVP